MSQNASDTTAARLFLRTVSQWFIMQKQASQAKAGRLEAAAVMTSVRVEQIQRSLAGLRAAPAVRFREGRQESAQHGSSRPVAPAPVSARQGPGVFLRTVGYTIPQYTVTSALTFASAMRHSAAGINGMYDASGRIDGAALQRVMERNWKEGAAGFFVGGSSGECFLQSFSRQETLWG